MALSRFRDVVSSIRWRRLDLESIINSNQDAETRKRLEDERIGLSGELLVSETVDGENLELLATGASTEFVAGKLKEITDRHASLEERLAAKEAEQLQVQCTRFSLLF